MADDLPLQGEVTETHCKLPSLASLPPHFVSFLRENQVPDDAYDLPIIYRFLRVNEKLLGQSNLIDIAAAFEEEVNTLANAGKAGIEEPRIVVEPVDWFASVGHRFLRLGVSHRIAGTHSYISGKLYGIDISSAAAVVALNAQAGDHVLDLCCAPGAKLSMISDLLSNLESRIDKEEGDGPFVGSVTGVDISLSRLSACRTVAKKYELNNVRLFLDDACTFNCLAPVPRRKRDTSLPNWTNKALPAPVFPLDISSVLPSALVKVPTISPKARKSMKKRNPNILDKLQFSADWRLTGVASELYDKAIVDAQCTLDASIRHLLNYNKVGWIEFDGNPSEVISQLQKRMLFNAFRLLKPGGCVVYSTCSFCIAQNEGVVNWLLKNEPTAAVVKIDWPDSFSLHINSGHLPHTVRFYPKNSGTSGMFIAKITKLKPKVEDE